MGYPYTRGADIGYVSSGEKVRLSYVDSIDDHKGNNKRYCGISLHMWSGYRLCQFWGTGNFNLG